MNNQSSLAAAAPPCPPSVKVVPPGECEVSPVSAEYRSVELIKMMVGEAAWFTISKSLQQRRHFIMSISNDIIALLQYNPSSLPMFHRGDDLEKEACTQYS